MHTLATDLTGGILSGLPDKETQNCQKIKNTAARILTRTKNCNHISPVLSYVWLTARKKYPFKIIMLTYKSIAINELAAPYLP